MDNVNDLNTDKIKKEQEVQEQLSKNVAHYRDIMNYLGCNLPIEVLCLPSQIEKVLLASGLVRVYDLIGRDLGKVKGLGKARRALLEERLDDFFVVHI